MPVKLTCLAVLAGVLPISAAPLVLRGADGVEAVFALRDGRHRWSAYRDVSAGVEWAIKGPLFSLQTADGQRTNLGDIGFEALDERAGSDGQSLVLQAELTQPPVLVRQEFAFCEDGRTLRIRTSLRATGEPVTIQRVGLIEIRVPGQELERIGPEHVSSPIVGDRIFVGVEHPSALCQVQGDTAYIAQHSYTQVTDEWCDVPSAVFGSASEADAATGRDGLRRSFLRYLDTVRVQPSDLHVHYNNWWTMPVPFTEQDVLDNIAELKQGLFDRTGFFFDSYAMDMGWSDPHSVWEVDADGYPHGFNRIRRALARVGSRPGLWVSPSSLYPPALDNEWLETAGYEVTPGTRIGRSACLARGGRYQQAFRRAVVKHAREGGLGHVKFDGLAWPCSVESHAHGPGIESFQPIAEGLADVFDALREQDPDIALEPTCLGYYPSPWWLMHTPFVIGPFGDDSPRGKCPAPEWIESMTTARDIANVRGRDAFWLPSSALECFDIIVQCPGDFDNHAVMSIARGHGFLSTYINPRFMDADEWRFFADLVSWARANRDALQEPAIFGGDPAQREPYGYAYRSGDRSLFFARNPWVEEAAISLPEPSRLPARELRLLYPHRKVLCRTGPGSQLPPVRLGPYELLVLEAVPTRRALLAPALPPDPGVAWEVEEAPVFERTVYESDPPAYGPSWTSPHGDADTVLTFAGSGTLRARQAAELCVLIEGPPGTMPATCIVTVNGTELPLRESGSRGAFYAAQAPPEEDWQWFLAAVSPGEHAVSYVVALPTDEATCGVFLRGPEMTGAQAKPFERGPAFPVLSPAHRTWSRTLIEPSSPSASGVVERRTPRQVVRIDGVYLDSLEWVEATSGWGDAHRNASVMGTPMTMDGRVFHRGIGTHAHSRIVYDVPDGCARFAATIGCDQEVQANSVVFVIEGDGRELFRSPLMRYDSAPIDFELSIAGVERLALILEDGGDGIIADHGNWANARLLR